MEECHFHLQLAHREWVIWGYGPNQNVQHIDPAEVVFTKPFPFSLPFKLPKPYEGGEPPQEYGRVTCWGWRLRSNDYIHDCGWNMAETREQAIAQAREWAEAQDSRDGWVRSGHRAGLVDAIDDIREY
jgi:hypothetical protein